MQNKTRSIHLKKVNFNIDFILTIEEDLILEYFFSDKSSQLIYKIVLIFE